MPLEITFYDVFKSVPDLCFSGNGRMDGRTDRRMDATKHIISLASRSIINHNKIYLVQQGVLGE